MGLGKIVAEEDEEKKQKLEDNSSIVTQPALAVMKRGKYLIWTFRHHQEFPELHCSPLHCSTFYETVPHFHAIRFSVLQYTGLWCCAIWRECNKV